MYTFSLFIKLPPKVLFISLTFQRKIWGIVEFFYFLLLFYCIDVCSYLTLCCTFYFNLHLRTFFFNALSWGRERERGRNGERETLMWDRNIDLLPSWPLPEMEPATWIRALTGTRTCDCLVHGTRLQPTEAHLPELCVVLFYFVFIFLVLWDELRSWPLLYSYTSILKKEISL